MGLWVEGLKTTLISFLQGREPFGPDGPRWYVVWKNDWGINVMKLDYIKDNLPRMIVIFIPWCKTIFSKAGVTNTFYKLRASERAALSAHWVQYFVQALAQENVPLITSKNFDCRVRDNILFNFYNYVHKHQLIHLMNLSAGLTFKNGILGTELRLDDLDIIGKNYESLEQSTIEPPSSNLGGPSN